MLSKQVLLTVGVLVRMMHIQKLGRAHPIIEPMPRFLDWDGDWAADAAMWHEFREVGLADRGNRLDGDALDTLAVLARPSIQYFGWFTDRGQKCSVLVGALGEEAVVALRKGDSVWLSSIRNVSLPETLIGQLPPIPPARMEALNIRRAELAVLGDNDPRAVLLDARPGLQREAAQVKLLAEQEPIGLGELYTGTLDGWGRREVLTEPIRYLDTRNGRMLVHLSGDYLSIAPASTALLANRLRQAHRTLA